MSNIDTLYQRCVEYFKDNQERINYFLNVLKSISEDKWHYHYSLIKEDSNESEEKHTLIYDNIRINNTVHKVYDYLSYGISTYHTIDIRVDNVIIYKIEYEDVLDELGDEIIEMFERVKCIQDRYKINEQC